MKKIIHGACRTGKTECHFNPLVKSFDGRVFAYVGFKRIENTNFQDINVICVDRLFSDDEIRKLYFNNNKIYFNSSFENKDNSILVAYFIKKLLDLYKEDISSPALLLAFDEFTSLDLDINLHLINKINVNNSLNNHQEIASGSDSEDDLGKRIQNNNFINYLFKICNEYNLDILLCLQNMTYLKSLYGDIFKDFTIEEAKSFFSEI